MACSRALIGASARALIALAVLIHAARASAQGWIADTSIYGGYDLPANTVALTYDDGPGRNTLAIAQYLSGLGIRATFYVNGCRFLGRPTPSPLQDTCDSVVDPAFRGSFLDSILALGHRIGNHSEDHVDLSALCGSTPEACAAALAGQILPVQNGLDRHNRDGLFTVRAPYGEWNPNTAAAMRSFAPQLIAPIGIDFWGNDWACLGVPPNTPQDCANFYLTNFDGGSWNRGFVLAHDRDHDTEVAGHAAQTTETLEMTQHLIAGLLARGVVFVGVDAVPGVLGARRFRPASAWSDDFTDAAGWGGEIGYYGTLRLTDVTGDWRADLCGRAPDGIRCVASTGAGFADASGGGSELWTTNFSDAQGWLFEQYGSTIQFGDVNGDGDTDVCGRGASGITCALGSSAARTFSGYGLWTSDFSDALFWDDFSSYYATVRLADVNGDGRADVCARGGAGIYCGLSTGAGFAPATLWLGSEFSNALAWLPDYYGSTIEFGDLDGDGRADVCGRGIVGMRCALAQPGGGFGEATTWLRAFADVDASWTARSRYRSIALADLNGDGRADVCARVPTGIACATSDGGKFVEYQHYANEYFHDLDYWAGDAYGATAAFGDLDGDGLADVCGRGVLAVFCALAAPAVRADHDWDGVYDLDDVCPFRADPSQPDTGGVGASGPNGIGDGCECGDVDYDGRVTASDVSRMRDPAIQTAPYQDKCSVRDGTLAGTECDLVDAVVLRRALEGLGPGIAPVCSAAVP